MSRIHRANALVVGPLLASLVLSCATNPATGKSQLNLYSEAQEIELGRQADAEIVAQLGLVDDPALAAWVSDVGRRLAAKSERPGLPWSFKVVDDPAVNAFALPGGLIYVTRGILGHLKSEAELASVIGHEIGHVTAQHGVNQMSKAQLAGGALMVGAILSPQAAQAAGSLAEAGLGILFLKYGRDDERQADDLGLRYTVGAGFEPREMPKVFDLLRSVGEQAGGGRIPNWLSSHPDPELRRERSERLIAERGYPAGEVGRESYLERIDGLRFGVNPRAGFFEGNSFFHPDLAFRFDLPAGWSAANETNRVVALNADKDAQLELTLASETSADAAASAFAAIDGLEAGTPRGAPTNGLQAMATSFRAPREGGEALVGRALFVEHGGAVFRILGLTLESKRESRMRALSAALGSFAPLTDRAKLGVEPQKIRLVELPRAMRFDEFLRDFPSDETPEVVALINGVADRSVQLAAGLRLKRLSGRKVGEQRIGPAGN